MTSMRTLGERATRLSPAWYLALASVVVYLAYPGSHERDIGVQLCILIILVTGLNFIAGYGGMPSLAQAGLFGVGAYTAAILDVHGIYGWAAFLSGPVAAGIVAAVVGAMSLHLRGMYFIMATLGVGLVVDLVASGAVKLTGGPNGLLGINRLTVGGLDFGDISTMYVLAAVLAVGCVALSWRFETSKLGLALRAMSFSEPAAEGCGVNPFRIRLVAFVVSGVFAGLAGSLETYYTGFVSPSSFDFFEGVLLLVAVILGGAGRVWGAVIGAALLIALQQVLQNVPDYQSLLLGIVFVIIIQRFPQGIRGGLLAVGQSAGRRWLRD